MATDRRLVSAEVLQQMRKPDELTSMQTRAFATMAVLASSALLFGADGTLARAPHDGVGRAAGRRLVFSDGFSGPAGSGPTRAPPRLRAPRRRPGQQHPARATA